MTSILLQEKALTAQTEGDLTRAATLLNPLHPMANAPFALEAQVYQTIWSASQRG